MKEKSSMFDPVEFVEWAVWYANERDAKLTPIRIVKFLYLADLYHARIAEGRILTGWKWTFVHYGPFCLESLQVIDKAEALGLIEGIPYRSKFDKDTKLYSHAAEDKPEDYPETLPAYVSAEIKRAIDLWADDTYGLLYHVYLETEPMVAAKPRDPLDFTISEKPTLEKALKMKPLSQKNKRLGKELLSKMRQLQEQSLQPSQKSLEPIYDSAFFKALEALDEQEATPEINGILNLKP